MNIKRDISIDILRGLAIFTMVAANLSAYLLIMPPPFLFRFYGTFAAPIFVMLSGTMVALKGSGHDREFTYYLRRGAMILTVAALIDVLIWHELPFIGVDVLYLIGLSMPLAYLFNRLNFRFQIITLLAIFSATPLLQQLVGYREAIVRIYDLGVLHYWLIDGWFPLFPWLGICCLGPVILKIRQAYSNSLGNWQSLLSGLFILISGAIIWSLFPGPLFIRENYSEMFYPSTIGYLLTAIGLILTLFSLIDFKPERFIYMPLQVLGEASLFFYVLHLCIIKYYFSLYWPAQGIKHFILLYLILMLLLILVGYGLRQLKSTWRNRPRIVKLFIG